MKYKNNLSDVFSQESVLLFFAASVARVAVSPKQDETGAEKQTSHRWRCQQGANEAGNSSNFYFLVAAAKTLIYCLK